MQQQDPGFFSFLLACLSGAFVSALRAKEGTMLERVSTGFVGFLVAFNFGPAIAGYFSLEPQYLSSCGFVIGMIGKEVSTVIIDGARDYGPAILRSITKRGEK